MLGMKKKYYEPCQEKTWLQCFRPGLLRNHDRATIDNGKRLGTK